MSYKSATAQRQNRGRLAWPTLLVLLAVLSQATAAWADLMTVTWIGGGKPVWSVPTNWDTGALPGAGNKVVIGGGSDVTLDVADVAIGALTIEGGSTLHISNTRYLTVAGGTIDNAGTLTLDSLGASTGLLIGGDVTLTGGGTVTLTHSNDNLTNVIKGASTGLERLTNANNTIKGCGLLGANFMALTNQGTIEATEHTGLRVDPTNGTTCINRGIMRSFGSADHKLTLYHADYDNANGQIVSNGGLVEFNQADVKGGAVAVAGAGEMVLSSSNLTGGTLTNSNTGLIHTGGVSFSIIGGAVSNPAGGRLVVDDSGVLTLLGGAGNSYINAGNIALNAAGNGATVFIDGDVTLTGGGTVTMSDNDNNLIKSDFTPTDRLTNADNTISGSGKIGADFMALTNRGTIIANQSSDLEIDPSPTGAINEGTLRAESDGFLFLIGSGGGGFNNSGGQIHANAGLVGVLANGAVTGGTVDVLGAGKIVLGNGSVTGGTLTNSSTGIISSSGPNTIGGTVTNPAGGQVIVEDNSNLTLLGGAGNSYANAGNIALNAAGNSATLLIGGDVTLTGGGTVTLSNNVNNLIKGATTGTERLTNVDNTISGSGNIGANFMALTNSSAGTIIADQSSDLRVDPSPAGAINKGTLRADSGKALILSGSGGGSFNNSGGQIHANDGFVIVSATVTGGTVDVLGAGRIVLFNGSVTGGTLTNGGTGIIRSSSGTNIIGGTVTNPAGGQVIVEDNSNLTLLGGTGNSYTNVGSIALNAAGNGATLLISGNVTLKGGGTVTLSNSGFNFIKGAVTGMERLTNADNTISGSGNIGVGFMALTNSSAGTIVASQSSSLIVDPSSAGAINKGTMRADSGAALTLTGIGGGGFNNGGGQIHANAGTVDIIHSAIVTGGTVDVVGAGRIVLGDGSVTGGTLTNSSTGIIRSEFGINIIGGIVTNPAGGQMILDDASVLVLTGGVGNSYTNAGNIALNSTGRDTVLRISGNMTLMGGGTVTLSDNVNNSIKGTTTGFERLTNADNTISGSGNIGSNFLALTNQGTIIANQSSSSLTVAPSPASVINTGTMRVDSDCTLRLDGDGGGNFANSGGQIHVNAGILQVSNGATVDGGTVDVIGAGEIKLGFGSVLGGTLTNSSTGTIRSLAGTANGIGGVVTNPVGGQIIVENSSNLLFERGSDWTNAGNIALNSTGGVTVLRINGDVILSGGGTVTLSDNTHNIISGVMDFHLLDNNDNTISGAGNIGINNMQLTNRGTIIANGSNPLTIDPKGADFFINTGTVQVEAGSTLILGSGDNLTQTGGSTIVRGTITASNGGGIVLKGGMVKGRGVITAKITNGSTIVRGTLTASNGGGIVLKGGMVKGKGMFIDAITNSGGTISPGESPGILTLDGNYAQSASGALKIELNGLTVGTLYDQLDVTGAVSLGGALNVTASFKPAIGATFIIIANDGTDAVIGTFAGLPQNGKLAVNGVLFQISYTGGNGNDVTLTRIAPPTLSINDITITEGTGIDKNATFTVTLSFASPQTVSVNAITANGISKSPADYTGGGKTLTFAPGQTSKTFSVPVIGDTLDEDAENFYVLLSSPVNASILRGRGTCTINDNDVAPSITIEDVNIGEGNGGQRTAVFRLHLSAPSGRLVKVNYATAAGTTNPATAGVDYVAVTSTQIAFTTGQTVTLARVLINGDALNEADETFKVNLSSAINATIADSQAIGTILNDDSAPAISINDVNVTEGNSGTKNLTFTVSLTAPSSKTISVNYTTADGVARSTSDYGATNGTLVFAANQTSRTVVVVINGDTQVEGDETLFMLLSGATNASIGKARGIGTILNDDSSP